MATLADIIDKSNDRRNIVSDINIVELDKYVIELIRISKMYKFEIKIRRKDSIKEKPEAEKDSDIKNIVEKEIRKTNIKEEIEVSLNEIRQYRVIKEDFSNDDIKISYNILPKTKDIEYKVEKPKIRYQELWEKEGFYQEKTTQVGLKVQLFPEHLPYDHFKRKRAFLFC